MIVSLEELVITFPLQSEQSIYDLLVHIVCARVAGTSRNDKGGGGTRARSK